MPSDGAGGGGGGGGGGFRKGISKKKTGSRKITRTAIIPALGLSKRGHRPLDECRINPTLRVEYRSQAFRPRTGGHRGNGRLRFRLRRRPVPV